MEAVYSPILFFEVQKNMLELVLAIAILILVIIIIVMYRDIKSKNYLIGLLRDTNNQLFEELRKYKGE